MGLLHKILLIVLVSALCFFGAEACKGKKDAAKKPEAKNAKEASKVKGAKEAEVKKDAKKGAK